MTSTAPRGRVGIAQVTRAIPMRDRLFVPGIVEGLRTTMRHFFGNVLGRRRYTQTISYPEETAVYPERFRGMHRLVPRADGTPRCVACFMCQTACPARCIHIVAAESDDATIEKIPIVFDIDELRCVVCGLCVEACPCDAIRMDTGFHPPPVDTRAAGTVGMIDLVAYLGVHERDDAHRSDERPPPTAGGEGRSAGEWHDSR